MQRNDFIAGVRDLSKKLKKDISVLRFKRSKIIQEEIVDAYQTPVPSAVLVKGRPRQVEVNEWIVNHADGSQSKYSDMEFRKVFEPEMVAGGKDETPANE